MNIELTQAEKEIIAKVEAKFQAQKAEGRECAYSHVVTYTYFDVIGRPDTRTVYLNVRNPLSGYTRRVRTVLVHRSRHAELDAALKAAGHAALRAIVAQEVN